MDFQEDWFSDKLSKLRQEDLRISTLTEIKDRLSSIPNSERCRIANSLDLSLVFDCLNDSNTIEVDLTSEVLSICMSCLNLGESTSKYGVQLEKALNHSSLSVKIIALTEIERNISKEELLIDLCKQVPLFCSIVRCLQVEDLSVASKAAKIIAIFGVSTPGLKVLISNDVVTVFREILSAKEEIFRLRVYEVLVNIAKESADNLNSIESTGIFSQMLEEFNTDDYLVRSNLLEILTALSFSRHGYIYIERKGFVNKIFSLLDNIQDFSLVLICEPDVLKFFGSMASSKPMETLATYPQIFDRLFDIINRRQRLFDDFDRSELTVIAITLKTLGDIGLSNEGKAALYSTGTKITDAIKSIVILIKAFPTEVKVTALYCLRNLIHVTDVKAELTRITREWYSFFGNSPMDFVMRYAKNPSVDLRLAGLGLIQAISEHIWGHEEIQSTPGLLEFLLDRNVESVKESKELKYEIVKNLANSTIFDHSILTRLQAFVKEGPFYVQAVMDVEFESNS